MDDVFITTVEGTAMGVFFVTDRNSCPPVGAVVVAFVVMVYATGEKTKKWADETFNWKKIQSLRTREYYGIIIIFFLDAYKPGLADLP